MCPVVWLEGVGGRNWGHKSAGIASCSLSCTSGCEKSQEQTIPRTAGGFYLTESSWLTLKENRGANNIHTGQMSRTPGTGNEAELKLFDSKHIGKVNQITFWSSFPKLKRVLFGEISGHQWPLMKQVSPWCGIQPLRSIGLVVRLELSAKGREVDPVSVENV